MISDVTFVLAFPENVLLGNLIAPKNSALFAIYSLTLVFFLSSVPSVVIKAIIPPLLTLSKVFWKK